MGKSNVSYVDAVYNPVTGCSHESAGCKHCWAEALSLRKGWTTKPWTAENAAENVVCHEDRLWEPHHWKKPRVILCCSMGDLHHERVPLDFLDLVYKMMVISGWHTFLVLTKRADRMAEYWHKRGLMYIPSSAVLGVTVENRHELHRLDTLRQIPAKRWVSFEPLLEDLGEVDLMGISGVVVGGESGPDRRPFDDQWARNILRQCREQRIAYTFKQHSHLRPGYDPFLDGVGYHEFPGNIVKE